MKRVELTIWGVALCALIVGCEPGPEPGTESFPHVILITVDTLRADHLGCYGHDRPTSPNIDALATEGLRFEQALSQAPWTLPSMASLHTGRYPSQHGAQGAKTRITADLPLLAEELQAEGYETMAVVSNRFVSEKHGFARGFDVFVENIVPRDEANSKELTRDALDAVEQEARGGPLFLWVHYFDPHFSYRRHEEFGFAVTNPGERPAVMGFDYIRENTDGFDEDDIAYILAVYDEEIAHTDRAIGELLAGLQEYTADRPTLIAFTGDHGEYFRERGRFGHGRELHPELVHVPLILGGSGLNPELRGTVVDTPVEVRSLAHTILARVGLRPERFSGEDLQAVHAVSGDERLCFSEGSYIWGADQRCVALVADGHKLILYLDDDRLELYDLDEDPGERRDLILEGGADVEARLAQLSPFMDLFRLGSTRSEEIELSDEDIEILHKLGYVE